MRAYSIFPFDPIRSMEMFYIEFDSGCHHASEKHNGGVEEYIMVLSGKLQLLINGNEVVVHKNEAIRFRADVPHEYTFRLKVPNEKASIIQKVPWSKLRSEEGEDRLVVTLINSPQLSKYAEDFREYLFIRAIFLGVDPDMLKKRYDRASGLPAAKRDELYRTAGFFRKSELDD